MSDQQDKSEEATPYKLDEARKKGQVPRSPDLLSFAMILTFLMVFSAIAAPLASVIAAHTHWWLGNAGQLGSSFGYLGEQGGYSVRQVVYAFVPLIGALVLVAVLTNLLFSGPVFSAIAIKPDFKRLNPIQGLKRIFSRRMFVELLKVLVKGGLFALVLYYLFQSVLPRLLGMATVSPMELPLAGKQLLMQLGFTVLSIMAAAALFDVWHSRREFGRQMRMSKRETKDEHKRREGDPEVRAKRKGIQQDLLKKASALGQVKDADVIITNPTCNTARPPCWRPRCWQSGAACMPCASARWRASTRCRSCAVRRWRAPCMPWRGLIQPFPISRRPMWPASIAG
jgi:flagellar biosynthesis protein FlhB